MTTTNLDLAISAAREYRARIDRGQSSADAKSQQLRDQIYYWVGRWQDGVMQVPQTIKDIMDGRQK